VAKPPIKRKCESWVETFIDHNSHIDSPKIFLRWVAIGTISAALEQKVWLMTSSRLYPNTYVFIVGHPGVGKTRAIRAGRSYSLELPEPHLAPTSMSAASLVDALLQSKRTFISLPDPAVEYNSIQISADELGAFMHKYDDEMVGVLSAFYDPDPYGQRRRGNDLKISIKSPQVNMIAGSTPSNLLKFIPEGAWDQGFCSRIMMVFSDERIVGDDFAIINRPTNQDLLHDLRIINSLGGGYSVTEEYRTAVNNWRALGEPPSPSHPKLLHYNTRRRVHLYKLSMVAAASKSNSLILTKDDFNTGMGWMLEAEELMPEIFQAGIIGADAKAMDEIHNFMTQKGAFGTKSMSETTLVNEARKHAPAHSVMRMLEIMERGGQIKCLGQDRFGMRFYQAVTAGSPSASPQGPLAPES